MGLPYYPVFDRKKRRFSWDARGAFDGYLVTVWRVRIEKQDCRKGPCKWCQQKGSHLEGQVESTRQLKRGVPYRSRQARNVKECFTDGCQWREFGVRSVKGEATGKAVAWFAGPQAGLLWSAVMLPGTIRDFAATLSRGQPARFYAARPGEVLKVKTVEMRMRPSETQDVYVLVMPRRGASSTAKIQFADTLKQEFLSEFEINGVSPGNEYLLKAGRLSHPRRGTFAFYYVHDNWVKNLLAVTVR